MKPRLKWHRHPRLPRIYYAGPYTVSQPVQQRHRPSWQLTKEGDGMALGHFHTATEAKQAAADDWVATRPAKKLKQLRSGDQQQRTDRQHKRPCDDCPWSRQALPGWLGSQTPDAWLADAHGEAFIECHTLTAQCAGAAIYRANVCKVPRDRSLLQLPADRATVFANRAEFLAHHGGVGQPPTGGKARDKNATEGK